MAGFIVVLLPQLLGGTYISNLASISSRDVEAASIYSPAKRRTQSRTAEIQVLARTEIGPALDAGRCA